MIKVLKQTKNLASPLLLICVSDPSGCDGAECPHWLVAMLLNHKKEVGKAWV